MSGRRPPPAGLVRLGVGIGVGSLHCHPSPADGAVPGLGRPAGRGHPRRPGVRRHRQWRSRSASPRSATTASGSRARRRTRARCSTRPRPPSSMRSRSVARIFGLLLSIGHGRQPRERHPDAALRADDAARGPGPGRATCWSRALGIGLIGGWLTRSPVASRRRSWATRSRGSRSSCAPGTPARPSRAAARSKRSRSDGARPTAGGSSVRASRRPLTRASPGPSDAARRPRVAPVALYVHVPFCVSLCPYCDFVVYRRGGGAGADERGRRVPRGAARGARAPGGRARRGVRAARRRPPRPTRDGLPRGRDAVDRAGRRHRAAAGPRPRAVRARGRCRDHARGQPRAGRARRPGALRRAGITGCRSGRSRWTTRSCGGWGGGIGRRRGRRGRARPGGRDPLDQPGPALRHPGTSA